jgi:hypothetical protein
VFVIYLGSLLFGGVLIAASALGAGHGVDAPAGGDVDAGVPDGHERSRARPRLGLLGIPFWSFGPAFFGLAGLVMRALGSPGLAPFVAATVGVGAGLGAASALSAKPPPPPGR